MAIELPSLAGYGALYTEPIKKLFKRTPKVGNENSSAV